MDQSRATDVLANERTFLAYARTALAFIGFGFVIARFSLFVRETALVAHLPAMQSGLSTTFGSLMALGGIACALYGGYRYLVVARALHRGSPVVSARSGAIAGTLAIVIIGAAVAFALPALR